MAQANPLWSKTGPKEKRKLAVEQVHRQEEMLRGTKAVAQAKQGHWLNWESVEKKKVSWTDLCTAGVLDF